MVYAIYALTRKSPILLYQLLLVQDRWFCASNILQLSARSPILSYNYRFCIQCVCSVSSLQYDDTALNAHQFRIGLGLADTRLCQCGRDIEDVHHYLLTCAKYESIRRDLLKSVDEVCSDDGHCSSLSLTASLFLSPWLHDMTDSECSEILAATFQFIYESARRP